jgi:hypothetical protein
MNYGIKLTLLTFLILCFGTHGLLFNSAEDITSHFESYSKFSDTHHDNIADVEHSHTHTHTHKHSEDGEEHEHHHDHSSTPQQPIKLLASISFKILEVVYEELKNIYSTKAMNSTEHPSSIFRPPIV